MPLSGAVTGVVLPFLREVGDRWEAGTLSVAHEHFVSDMLRRTLSALSSVPPHQVLEDAPRRRRSCCSPARRGSATTWCCSAWR